MKKVILVLIAFVSLNFVLSAQCPPGVEIVEALVDPNSSSGFNFDTDGDGSADTNDEFVKICNNSPMDADMTGFSLNDAGSGDWFTFPAGYIIPAGECVTVVNDWDGSVPPAGVLDADRGTTGIINNGGDAINLTSAGGDCATFNAIAGTDGCPQDAAGNPLACGDPAAYDFAAPTPLPVELISFSAKEMASNTAELTWVTASELDNDYFSVEYSSDGVNFKEIEKITGAGTTWEAQSYSFIHKQLVKGDNYYRLRQVDFNGQYEYSSIVNVNIKNDDTITVRPTLANNELNILTKALVQNNATIQIYDLTGRLVLSTQMPTNTDQSTIDIAALMNGQYLLRFINGQEIKTVRFVKI